MASVVADQPWKPSLKVMTPPFLFTVDSSLGSRPLSFSMATRDERGLEHSTRQTGTTGPGFSKHDLAKPGLGQNFHAFLRLKMSHFRSKSAFFF